MEHVKVTTEEQVCFQWDFETGVNLKKKSMQMLKIKLKKNNSQFKGTSLKQFAEEQLDIQHGKQDKLLHCTTLKLLFHFPVLKNILYLTPPYLSWKLVSRKHCDLHVKSRKEGEVN